MVLVVPMFERQAPGVYRNSAAIIDADGSLLGRVSQDAHPRRPAVQREVLLHAGRPHPGFAVWQTRYATIGVLICWDQWYPEAARITSLMGAQVLFYPTAIGWHPSEQDEWGPAQVDAWRTIQRSHAIANGVYVASPNRIGHEDEPGTDGLNFFGHSFIADPFGRYLAEAGAERGSAGRALRAGADRNRAPQLAVPARSPHRRLRPDPAALPRMTPADRRTPQRWRMPAEWEPHRATWIAWPHYEPDWPGKLAPIPWVYGEIVARAGRLRAGRDPLPLRAGLRERRRDPREPRRCARDRIRLHLVPNDRTWLRDSAPTGVVDPSGAVTLLNWSFNAWAKYANWRVDAAGRPRHRRHRAAAARRADAPRHRRARWCSRAAASRSTAPGCCSSPRSGC